MAGALLIGAGLQAYSAIKSGEEKKAAYQTEAFLKQRQAAQVDLAVQREIELTRQRAEIVKGSQLSSFGRSGVQATAGSTLIEMENTAANAASEMMAIRQAGEYRKNTLLDEASFSDSLGKEAADAGYFSAGQSVLTAASKNPYSYDAKRIKPKQKVG